MNITSFTSLVLMLLCLYFTCKSQEIINDSIAFNMSVEKVKAYNHQIDSINILLRHSPSDIQLRAELNQLLTECFQVPIDFIGQYPESPYAVPALRMLGQGSSGAPVSKAEILRLFDNLSDSVKNSDEGVAYLINLKSWGTAVVKDELEIAALSERYRKLGYLDHLAFKEKLKAISRQQEESMLTAARATIEIDSLLNESKPTDQKKIHLKKHHSRKKKLSSSEIYSKLKSATLIVCIVNSSDTDQFLKGTAYTIDEAGICVTNYHVLKAFADGHLSDFFMSNSEGEYFPVIKVLAVSPLDDLAILQIDTKGKKLSALSLGSYAHEGTSVYAMGHADDFFYYFTKGMVAGNYTFVDRGYFHSKVLAHPIMMITADYSVGSSGGPVVDEYGNVVGTISQTNTIYSNKERKIDPQMVIKKTIPVLALKELVGRF